MQSGNRNRSRNTYCNIDNQRLNNFVKSKKCNETTIHNKSKIAIWKVLEIFGDKIASELYVTKSKVYE